MKWLKRLALKWLVNDRDFYDIMCALRGPDEDSNYVAKFGTTAVVRRLVGMRKSYSPAVIAMEGKTIDVSCIPEKPEFDHFRTHILDAYNSLKRAGYDVEIR